MVRLLARVIGVGIETADMLVHKKPTKEKDAPPCLNFLTKKAPYKG